MLALITSSIAILSLQIQTLYVDRTVAVAKFADWSLLITEVCGSNPVIGKILFTVKCLKD